LSFFGNNGKFVLTLRHSDIAVSTTTLSLFQQFQQRRDKFRLRGVNNTGKDRIGVVNYAEDLRLCGVVAAE
jgi:hypothetical protein